MNIELFRLLDDYFKSEIQKAIHVAKSDVSSFDYRLKSDRSTILREQILKYIVQQESDNK